MDFKKDYYNILGVDKKATTDDIKKAYRKLAMENHPDRNPDDEAKKIKFQDINEANQVLSDEQKRAKYDQGEPANNMGDYYHFRRNTTVENLVNLKISVNVPVDFYINEKEITCNYTRGSAEGSKSITCPSCNGAGGFDNIFTCAACGGTGQYVQLNRKNEEIKLKIKKGQIHYKFPGMGEAVSGTHHGAMIIILNLTPANGFSVDPETYNLTTKVKIDISKFLTGGEVVVDVFGTKYKIKHENVGEANRTYRLKGKGLFLQNIHSDLIVEITPKFPVDLSKKEKELINKLSNEAGFSVQYQTL